MEKFKIGHLAATKEVSERMQHDLAFAAFVSKSIRRYKECDWGDSSKEDKASNDAAVENGNDRISATYAQVGVKEPMKILIITERDRSATTIMFPEEY